MATVWGGSCLAVGLAAARAEAAATGRPVLTEASFNQMMREAQASGRIKQMASEARRDLKGWLERSFSLTPVQRTRIQAMSSHDAQQISNVIAPVAEQGGEIRISMSEAGQQKPAQKRAKEAGFGKKIIGVRAKAAREAAERAHRVELAAPAGPPPTKADTLQPKVMPKEATR
jgi:hypothetical protein